MDSINLITARKAAFAVDWSALRAGCFDWPHAPTGKSLKITLWLWSLLICNSPLWLATLPLSTLIPLTACWHTEVAIVVRCCASVEKQIIMHTVTSISTIWYFYSNITNKSMFWNLKKKLKMIWWNLTCTLNIINFLKQLLLWPVRDYLNIYHFNQNRKCDFIWFFFYFSLF